VRGVRRRRGKFFGRVKGLKQEKESHHAAANNDAAQRVEVLREEEKVEG
jgi:hypothetical protein